MRICVLTHTFPRNTKDVSAAFMKEFSDGLSQNDNKVFVVTPFDKEFSRKGDVFKIYAYKYIWPDSLHTLGYSRTMEADVSLRKRVYLLLPFMLFFGAVKLFYVVKKEKIDVINVHWILPNGLIAFVVSKLTRVPYVVTLPGTDAYLAYRYKVFGLVAKIVAMGSSGIISNNSWHLKRILDLGVGSKPSAVISYPVDVSSFRPINRGLKALRLKYNIKQKNFVILAVGRLVYKKGFKYLIRAVSYLANKYPDIRLVIGGEGDLRGDLERLVERENVSDRVIFVGNIARDEIIYYYNIADVLVAPSIVDRSGNVDGGPVVVAESMACAKPQVLTDVLGMADIIHDGVNGFVVPQRDSEAIAKAVEKLIEFPILKRRQIGRANRVLVKAKLSTKSIGRRYTDFFKKYVK